MKTKIQTALLLTIGFLFSANANAFIYIEPFGGYNVSGKLDDESATGPEYGGRLGFGAMGFNVGGQFAMATIKYESSGTEYTVKGQDIGAFMNFSPPGVPIHIWA